MRCCACFVVLLGIGFALWAWRIVRGGGARPWGVAGARRTCGCRIASRGRCSRARRSAGPQCGRAGGRRRLGAVHAGARRRARGQRPPGVRRFHRGLVRHLPGQQAARAQRRRRARGIRAAQRRARARRLDAPRSRDHAGAVGAWPERRPGLRAVPAGQGAAACCPRCCSSRPCSTRWRRCEYSSKVRFGGVHAHRRSVPSVRRRAVAGAARLRPGARRTRARLHAHRHRGQDGAARRLPRQVSSCSSGRIPNARSCASTTTAATCRACRRNGAPATSSGSRSTRPTPPTPSTRRRRRWRNGSKAQGAAPKATLIDGTSATGRAYAAQARRRTCSSSIRRATVIYNGAIDDRRTTNPADAKLAHNYVRAALTEAMDGRPVTVATTSPYGCSVKYGSLF